MSEKVLDLTLSQKISLWLSSLCLIHCLITPFIIILLPAVSTFFSDTVEWILIISVIPISSIAFFPIWKNHKNRMRLYEFLAGISLVIIAQTVFHFILQEGFITLLFESLFMFFGVGLIAYATYKNRQHTHHCANLHHSH